MTAKALLLLVILSALFLLICLSSIFSSGDGTFVKEEAVFDQKLTLPTKR